MESVKQACVHHGKNTSTNTLELPRHVLKPLRLPGWGSGPQALKELEEMQLTDWLGRHNCEMPS